MTNYHMQSDGIRITKPASMSILRYHRVCAARNHHLWPLVASLWPKLKKKVRGITPLTCDFMVGTTGFEPAASRSRTVRATKRRHVPTLCRMSTLRRARLRCLRTTVCELQSTVHRRPANRMSGSCRRPVPRGFVATFVATPWPACGHKLSNEPFTCDSSAFGN